MPKKNSLLLSETENWVSPAQALDMFDGIYSRPDAIKKLVVRLQADNIRAIAESVFIPADGITTPNVLMSAQLWRSVDGDFHAVDFWRTGDIQCSIRRSGEFYSTTHHCLGVRLDPVDVRKLLPRPAVPNPAPAAAPTIETSSPDEKGPPVAEAHLAAWYEVYKQAYNSADDTLPRALESARGMFPGKFVSRDRVRELCAGRKAGRKPVPSV